MGVKNIEIKPTLDGSCTLFDPELNETYHSLHGALSESLHVYIHNGLDLINLKEKSTVKILEIGFGTGMNFILTNLHRPEGVAVEYLSLEPFPLSLDLLKSYYTQFESELDGLNLLYDALQEEYSDWKAIKENFIFWLNPSKIQDLEIASDWKADLVYFDAFAPSRQPEMWNMDVLSKVEQMMAAGAILTTYCAQGQFKRNLKQLGLFVENPKGANGKREMTIARKL